MMRSTKLTKKTKPKTKAVAKIAPKAKVKVKSKYNLKGIPVKYKMICNLAILHADTQIQCDELLLVGVNAYETLLENETPENAEKMKMDIVPHMLSLKRE